MTEEQPTSQPSYVTATSRAMRLLCPRCGVGSLFKNFVTMHERCQNCSLIYEREPGYFLGSTYVNYGIMAITLTSAYMALHYGLGLSNESLMIPLGIYCVVMPLILFRYARAWWLAMDCYCDPAGFGVPRKLESNAQSSHSRR